MPFIDKIVPNEKPGKNRRKPTIGDTISLQKTFQKVTSSMMKVFKNERNN
jgi:hypothetical protein